MRISSSSMPRTTRMVAQRSRRARGPAEAPEPQGPMKPERTWSINLWMLLGVPLVAALVTAVLRALPEGLGWLFEIPAMHDTVGELGSVLAPT